MNDTTTPDQPPAQPVPAKRQLHVTWHMETYLDMVDGGWEQIEVDTKHDWGLCRHVACTGRRSGRQHSSWFTIDGYDGKIESGPELFRVLEQLGHIPLQGGESA